MHRIARRFRRETINDVKIARMTCERKTANLPVSFIGIVDYCISVAPIPGGCNMEFDIEIAPYQKLSVENDMITVDTQPGSVLAANGLPLPCDKQLVHHRMYRLYLPKQDFTPDTYFEGITSMVTPQDIVRNGDEVYLA